VPLLSAWAAHLGLQDADAADLVQEVFLHLYRVLPTFRYDAGGSFRAWLRTVLVNKHREISRRRQPSSLAPHDEANLPGGDAVAELTEDEYRRHLVGRALELMQRHFPPTAWKACWEAVVCGRAAKDVAAELGITPAVVYVSRFRVLQRLRSELAGLLD
jgi:RNA polymerase sigma-70 factor (ECF subfamily)